VVSAARAASAATSARSTPRKLSRSARFCSEPFPIMGTIRSLSEPATAAMSLPICTKVPLSPPVIIPSVGAPLMANGASGGMRMTASGGGVISWRITERRTNGRGVAGSRRDTGTLSPGSAEAAGGCCAAVLPAAAWRAIVARNTTFKHRIGRILDQGHNRTVYFKMVSG